MTDTAPLVHSLMPMAVDPETGTVTFGRLEGEDPSRPVRSVADLPEVGLDLFLFQTGKHMRLWIDGVREVATNAVGIALPEMHDPRFCLLIRHDRDRRPGDTLNDVVALHDMRTDYGREDVAILADRLRRNELERLATLSSNDVFDRRWEAEMKVVRETTFLTVDRDRFRSVDPGIMRLRGVGRFHEDGNERHFTTCFNVRRSGPGYAISWFALRAPSDQLDADLERRIADLAHEEGLHENAEDHGYELRSSTFDLDALDQARRISQSLENLRRDLSVTNRYRTAVTMDYANATLKKIVTRSAAGFPPVIHTSDHSCVQASPAKGKPIEMPAVHVRRAIEAGYLEYVWTWGYRVNGVDCAVLDATDLGRVFVDGGFDEVVERMVRRDGNETLGRPPATPIPVSLRQAISPRSAPSGKARAILEAEADWAVRKIRMSPSSREGYAVMAACLAHGVTSDGIEEIASRAPAVREASCPLASAI